jgi:uncharacterized membrane protein (UPF0182 family)
LPELKRIIVASGTRIAMSTTLDSALEGLLLNVVSAPEIAVGELATTEQDAGQEATQPVESDSGQTTTDETIVGRDAIIEALITSANGHFEAAEAAQRNGDWSRYGDELRALQDDLQRLMELAGGG